MKHKLIAIALGAIAISNAGAQTYPYAEYCSGSALEQKVADATAFVVPQSALTLKPNGKYSLSTVTMVDWFSSIYPICANEPIYGQQRATQGRTAFLVGDNLMITAAHEAAFPIQNYAVIFGLHATQQAGVCTQPDTTDIPAANVVKNLVPVTTAYSGTTAGADFLLFELPSPKTGVTPLPVRRSGSPDTGARIFTFGHPLYMTGKLSHDAFIRQIAGNEIWTAYIPLRIGASGAPVFNEQSFLVETALARQQDLGADDFASSYDPGSMCYGITRAPVLPQLSSAATNAVITGFSANVPIPPTQLQVSQQSTVTHIGPTSGPLSNATTQFTVAPPPTATGPLSFNVSMPFFIPPAPAFSISPGPGSYTLNPGDPPLQFTVTAGVGAIACKIVNTGLSIIPTSPADNFTSRVNHRFEIGMVDFSVSNTSAWNVSELGAPYPTRTFEIVNVQPHASAITVAPSAAWLRVNGSASLNLNLAAAGSPGDRVTVTTTIDDSQAGMPAQSQTANATIDIGATTTACGKNSVQIPVSFTRGIEKFDGTSPAELPRPTGGQTFGAVVELPVDVDGDTFTVDDIDAYVRLLQSPQVQPPLAALDTSLKVELVAPDGTSALLWDRNETTPGYIVDDLATFLGIPNQAVDTLKLDQATTPPLGGGSLNTFNGHAGVGQWKFRLRSADPLRDIVVVNVGLRITKKHHASLYTLNTVYDYIPGPGVGQTFGTPADFLVDLSGEAAFTVNDVDLRVGFYEGPPFLGLPALDQALKVELTSPNNTTSVLWDRNNATGSYLGSDIIDWISPATGVATLDLDTTVTPPLGGGSLSVFNGQAGKGVWRVRLYTTDTSQRVLPSHVNLKIGR